MKKCIALIFILLANVSYAQIFCRPGVDTPGSDVVGCDTTLTTNDYCRTRIFVNSNQTVSFYLKDVTRYHEFGTIRVGQSIQDTRCFADENIIAVTWNDKAKAYQTKTLERQGNVNRFIYVEYPRDFKDPYIPDSSIICQTEIFNNSTTRVDFYDGHTTTKRFLMRVEPMHKQLLATPCYLNKSIVALSAAPIRERLNSTTFTTDIPYSNINHFVFLTFPDNFSASTSFLMHMFRHQEYKMLENNTENAIAAPKQTYQNVKNNANGNTDDNADSTADQTGHWSISSGVVG